MCNFLTRQNGNISQFVLTEKKTMINCKNDRVYLSNNKNLTNIS